MYQSQISRVLACSFVAMFFIACSPYYKSIRPHIPQHDAPGQWQIDADFSASSRTDDGEDFGDGLRVQIDGSYSVTDSFLVQIGAHTDTYDSDSTQSNYRGVHFGGGHYSVYGADDRYRLSLIAGASFEQWDYDIGPDDPEDPDGQVGFRTFESTVVNPFAQLGCTVGSRTTNMSVAYRLEAPIFDFQKVQPSDESEKGQTIISSLVFQGKVGLFHGLSLYMQLLARDAFMPEDQPYRVIPMDLFIGLSYAFGEAE